MSVFPVFLRFRDRIQVGHYLDTCFPTMLGLRKTSLSVLTMRERANLNRRTLFRNGGSPRFVPNQEMTEMGKTT